MMVVYILKTMGKSLGVRQTNYAALFAAVLCVCALVLQLKSYMDLAHLCICRSISNVRVSYIKWA